MSKVDLFFARLNKNFVFRYISSIKLAIPLMLIVSMVVAWGTVVESQYNSEYSSLLIYKSGWFGFLLILLWINIFSATLSRWPWKKHHTGFIITHIGLLTLLMGGYITNESGTDGQLMVQENQSSRSVVLPNLMFGYQIENQPNVQKIVFKKMLKAKEKEDLNSINNEIGQFVNVEKYIPFAKTSRVYKSEPSQSDEIALSFILKSQFFNVNEWLHTTENAQMQMGPATLKITKVQDFDLNVTTKKLKPQEPQSSHTKKLKKKSPTDLNQDKVLVFNPKNTQESREILVSDLQKNEIEVFNLKLRLQKKYRSAIVAGNKLNENPDPSISNPALELQVEQNNKVLREVLYANFKDFSLNKDGVFGYRMEYLNSVGQGSDEPDDPVAQDPQSIKSGSRVIEFKVSSQAPHKTQVVLYKEGQEVLKQILSEGEKLTTPWMGMEIFIGTIEAHALESSEVTAINPEKRSDLPTSAILLNTAQNQKIWLTEGEQKTVSINDRNFTFYYGKEIIDLPFEVTLKKFTKLDYPGTSTPMSFESLVQINDESQSQKISMNEPFKKEGFTLYQASYIMNPTEAPISIFSVNKDPGRWLKYLGSLILSIGVITFTLMRSRLAKSTPTHPKP
ncbi:MAG TPA: cytochrome c biogenesis protein ResB [Pseudobdellovibrionaceae bacterium]|nr:cytochrome c biogenesis protein ResB [Pseudobdellovibrionaceae bacterium]